MHPVSLSQRHFMTCTYFKSRHNVYFFNFKLFKTIAGSFMIQSNFSNTPEYVIARSFMRQITIITNDNISRSRIIYPILKTFA